MEWFWSLIDQLQKSIAVEALQSFSVIDWVLLFAILIGMAVGSRRGFSDMLGKLFGILLVSMLTVSLYKGLAGYFEAHISILPDKLSEAFAFFILGVFFWISITWCINLAGKFFKVEAQGLLKTLGGMIFGILWVSFWISFIAQFLLFLPIKSVQELFQKGHSYTGHTISRLVPDLHKVIVSPFEEKKPLKSPAGSPKAGG